MAAGSTIQVLQSKSAQANNLGKPHQQHVVFFENPKRDMHHVSHYTHALLIKIAEHAKVPSLKISSTVRNTHEQATQMLVNIHKNMHYAAPGKAVLAVARGDLKAGKSRDQTIADMEKKIDAVGLSHVTHHAFMIGMNTVDLSIKHFGQFDDALWAYSRVIHALIGAAELGEVFRFGWPEGPGGKVVWPKGLDGKRGKFFYDAACLHVEVPQLVGDFPELASDTRVS
jgi:hypothetical protein